MSKYAAGVYSTAPAEWGESRWQSLAKIKPVIGVIDAPDGEGEAESFTIQPGKHGETATLVARIGAARCMANSTDPAICAALRSGPVAGRKVRVESGENGVNAFWFV